MYDTFLFTCLKSPGNNLTDIHKPCPVFISPFKSLFVIIFLSNDSKFSFSHLNIKKYLVINYFYKCRFKYYKYTYGKKGTQWCLSSSTSNWPESMCVTSIAATPSGRRMFWYVFGYKSPLPTIEPLWELDRWPEKAAATELLLKII